MVSDKSDIIQCILVSGNISLNVYKNEHARTHARMHAHTHTHRERDIMVPDATGERLARSAGLKVLVLNNLNMSIHQ